MNLEVYSGRDLQMILSFLEQGRAEGMMDITELHGKVKGHVNNVLGKEAKAVDNNGKEICPSCLNGVLRQVSNQDGLVILGCRLCRYSRIEGDK